MYKQGDIVLIPIPFTDLSSSKKRPVLILSSDHYNDSTDDLIVAAITSNIDEKPYNITITNSDLTSGNLLHTSCIKTDKLYTLAQSIVIKKFGTLKQDFLVTVIEKIYDIITMKKFPIHLVCVYGIVENDKDEVLLLKSRNKNSWMFPGGQVESGENLIDAVIRETKEESNMDIAVNKLFCVSSNTCTYKGHSGYGMIPTKVMMGFICTYINGEFVESDETTEFCWVHKDKVLDLLTTGDFADKYKAYLNYNGNVKYSEYVNRPEYLLKVDRLV